MERWRERDGQATGEYVAVVALVATTLLLAAGLTSGGLGPRVLAGLQRGLCAVAARDCPRPTRMRADLAPCPLERSAREERLSETIAVVRLGSSGTLSAERGSDGRVTVTLANGSTAGDEVGAGLRLRLGGRALGAAARASLVAAWTAGRSWTLPSAAAAHDFVARYGEKATIGGKLVDEVRSGCSLLCDAIGWRPHPRLPEPDAVYEEGGALAALTASLGLGARSAGGGVESAALLGRRIARDGATTWYLRLGTSAAAALGVPAAELTGAVERTAVLSYALDARGRPAALGIRLAGAVGADGSVTASGLAPARATAGAGVGRLVELDATLDLHEPANRAAATAVLAALSDPARLAALPSRAAALRRRIADHGVLDRRTYAVRRSGSGVGAAAGLGVEVAGSFDRTSEGLRLIDAETRLPGLPFLPRDDCRP